MISKSQPKTKEAPSAGTLEASEVHQTTAKGDTMNSSIQTQSTQLPVIAGHEITTDEHGRFSLNAIHRASGEGEHKRPSKWTVTAQAKELIEELESQSPKSGFAAIGSKHGGSSRGTYAHELLAVSYAGWISARFQLQVNQVFLDYRMGRLNRVAENDSVETKRIGKTTTKDRAPLKQLVNTIVDARTRRGHPSDYSSAWREINGYLGLESIQDATHEQIETGITFARKVLEGELCSPQFSLPDSSQEIIFDDDEMSDLYILLCHAYVIEKKWRESRIEEALSLLHAPIGGNLHENIHMAATFARRISKAKGDLMERSRERLGLNHGLIPTH